MSYTKPDTGVGLDKPHDNTVASPLCLKFIVVEMLATPPTTEAHHNIYQAHMWPLPRSVHMGRVAM